ncbi:putative hydrolase [Aspergillus steynii IBT 23096]|uniref:Putative hydrolase n=1 Tax=Aspergillus steynii IBT 23096 TaxID=1392250 RepID=A0A2I2GCR1_9EURO|nr:putative hydrolase [Aspergillus steynii IBT 23096]PLB50661.1 putative hydrolase [Aspergillus steynii IBT 23096]
MASSPLTQIKYLHLPTSQTRLFYRESGPQDAPVILLLHGFPASSHQYRNLVPLLATKYHILAPGLPGFGFTEAPETFHYTFDNLANTVLEFLDALSIQTFTVYIFDYGAPTALRIALKPPTRITAVITQNGNAYTEGLSDFWAPIRAFWLGNNTPSARADLAKNMLSLEATKWQYEHGTCPTRTIAPESYTLDYALLQRPGNADAQVDLFWDYQNNIALYPRFQEYFRKSQVPVLAVWGRNDPIFVSAGAEAFKRDLPDAEVHLLDAGHFAVETDTEEIGGLVLGFLERMGI